MDVNSTFYAVEGNSVPGRSVTLRPAEVQHIHLADLIPPSHSGRKKMGGVQLTYFGQVMEVAAQITLFGRGKAGSVDIPFSASMDYRSNVQEAVWWLPEKGEATIILGNASNVAVAVNLRYSTGESQDVLLDPLATEVIVRRRDNTSGSP